MHIARDKVPVKIDAPGAVARQQLDFGDASPYGKMSGEYFSFGKDTDITELLHGLEGNLCQCPHWGYVIRGNMTATDATGNQETVQEGDLFYWPPGHTVRANSDTDFVMFSPQDEHTKVLRHVQGKLQS